MNHFSIATVEKIGYYVYCLYDPRDKKIFYIGKGKGNRVFKHMKGAIEGSQKNEKLRTIRAIIKNKIKVGHYILKHGLEEKEAVEIESCLIDMLTFRDFKELSKLTNIVSGYHSWDRGIKTVNEIEALYAAKPIYNKDIKHKILIININKTYKPGISPYDATRKSWKLDINRAKNAEFIISEYKGIFRAIYKANKWFKTADNKRLYFKGEEVTNRKIIILYLNRQYSEKKKGQINPIRYLNC